MLDNTSHENETYHMMNRQFERQSAEDDAFLRNIPHSLYSAFKNANKRSAIVELAAQCCTNRIMKTRWVSLREKF